MNIDLHDIIADRKLALRHVRKALRLCDSLGESRAACYLQFCADILASGEPESDQEDHGRDCLFVPE